MHRTISSNGKHHLDNYVGNVSSHPKSVSIYFSDGRIWRFSKCAECGGFRLPVRPGAIQSGVSWRSSRSIRSVLYSTIYIDRIFIAGRYDRFRMRDAECHRIFKLNFRSKRSAFGKFPNTTHPHERDLHLNPKIFPQRYVTR